MGNRTGMMTGVQPCPADPAEEEESTSCQSMSRSMSRKIVMITPFLFFGLEEISEAVEEAGGFATTGGCGAAASASVLLTSGSEPSFMPLGGSGDLTVESSSSTTFFGLIDVRTSAIIIFAVLAINIFVVLVVSNIIVVVHVSTTSCLC